MRSLPRFRSASCPNCNQDQSTLRLMAITPFNGIQCQKCRREITFNKWTHLGNFVTFVIIVIVSSFIATTGRVLLGGFFLAAIVAGWALWIRTSNLRLKK